MMDIECETMIISLTLQMPNSHLLPLRIHCQYRDTPKNYQKGNDF